VISNVGTDFLPSFRLLQVETGEVISTFEGIDRVVDWVLGSRAQFLAVLDGSRRARIFDPRTGTVVAELRHSQDLVRLVATSDDDTLVTVDTDGAVHGWRIDAADGGKVVRDNWLIGTTADPASVGLSGAVDELAFALADGIVVAQDLYGARRAQHFRAHRADLPVLARVAPRAERLVTVSGPLFRVWRLEPSPPSATIQRDLSSVAIDAGGAIAVFGYRGGHVRVSRVDELAQPRGVVDNVDYIGHRGAVTSLAVNAARNVIASGGSDGVVRVWNMATVAPSQHFFRHPAGPIWQAQTGDLISDIAVDGAAMAVAVSADAGLIAVGDTAGNIFFGAPRGPGPLLAARAHAAVTSLALSRDLGRIASGDSAGNLQIWNTADDDTQLATYLFQEAVSWVEFSWDGAAVFARSGPWVHELRMNADGLRVVASRLLPIGIGPQAMAAVTGDDSIRWLAGATTGEPAYADIDMDRAGATALPADPSRLERAWPAILGLDLDRSTGTVRIAR
jgi:WD40 repeat protein